MICKDARDRLVDRLLDDLTEAQSDGLERHLAACPACRADAASMDQTWQLLGADPDERPDSEGRERLVSAARDILARSPRVAPKRRPWLLRIAALVTWLLIGFAAGFGMGSGSEAQPVIGEDTYIILVHEDETAMSDMPRDELRAAGAAYRDWVQRHTESGELLEAAWLPQDDAVWIEGRDGIVAERPFDPGARELTYYWLVRADSRQRAVDIARTCPFLYLGARLELRRAADPEGGKG